MEIDLPLITPDTLSEGVDSFAPLERKASINKELPEESFNTSTSDNLAKESDITENSLYISACEESPEYDPQFTKMSNSNALCLDEKFELNNIISEKENIRNIHENSLLSSSLVGALDETLLSDSKIKDKNVCHPKESVVSSSDFPDAQDLQRDIESHTSSSSAVFHDTLDSIHQVSANEEKLKESNRDQENLVAQSLSKEVTSLNERLKLGTPNVTVLSVNENTVSDNKENSNFHEYSNSDKLLHMTENPSSSDFTVHKLNDVSHYIDETESVNILEFDKYDLARKVDDGECFTEKVASNLGYSDKDEFDLSMIGDKHPEKVSLSDASTRLLCENSSSTSKSSDKEADTLIFLAEPLSQEDELSDNIEEFTENLEIKDSEKSTSSAPDSVNSATHFDKIEIDSTFKRLTRSRSRPHLPKIGRRKPDVENNLKLGNREESLKRKLNEMLTNAEDGKNKAYKQISCMKEEKNQILQEILIEIERLSKKFVC